MILKQYYLGCLAHASYLIADENFGRAVVVDPQRDIELYLDDAKSHGLSIEHVFLTHFHADFVAGHLELRDRVGAQIHLGRRASADYPFVAAGDRDRLDIGSVRIEVLETPGHTPEGISLVVYDLDASPDEPHAVLTGDTLFIGDVGRPDLLASIGVTKEELADMLYSSLRDKLMLLPDETLVYPAHGAGSMCGKNLSSDTVSTIGVQKELNYALQPMSRDEFVRIVTADQPEAPGYFSFDADLNRRERSTLDEALTQGLTPLGLDEVLDLHAQGAYLLDVREAHEFAAAHLRGSLNIGLGGKYATWAGSLLDREHVIVIIGDSGQETEAATRLGRIGFDHVAGYLESGMAALQSRDDLVVRAQRITAADLAAALAEPGAPLVVDVRAAGERANGAIDGSVHIPLNQLRGRLDEVPRDRRVVFQCASGYRSSAAQSMAMAAGIDDAVDLIGGISAWEAGEFPIQKVASAAS